MWITWHFNIAATHRLGGLINYFLGLNVNKVVHIGSERWYINFLWLNVNIYNRYYILIMQAWLDMHLTISYAKLACIALNYWYYTHDVLLTVYVQLCVKYEYVLFQSTYNIEIWCHRVRLYHSYGLHNDTETSIPLSTVIILFNATEVDNLQWKGMHIKTINPSLAVAIELSTFEQTWYLTNLPISVCILPLAVYVLCRRDAGRVWRNVSCRNELKTSCKCHVVCKGFSW